MTVSLLAVSVQPVSGHGLGPASLAVLQSLGAAPSCKLCSAFLSSIVTLSYNFQVLDSTALSYRETKRNSDKSSLL